MKAEYYEKAKEIAGKEPTGLAARTAYNTLTSNIAKALQSADDAGAYSMKHRCADLVNTCVVRDPTMQKLLHAILDIN